jgi:hypothetical protein
MEAFHPGFGAQVFEIDPQMSWLHLLYEAGRRIACECLDHDVMRTRKGHAVDPAHDFDALDLLCGQCGGEPGFNAGKAVCIIHPEADFPDAACGGQLARQTPADADIAVVVDDAAENIE